MKSKPRKKKVTLNIYLKSNVNLLFFSCYFVWMGYFHPTLCLRPYHVENTSSRPITEVKQRRAELVLGWVTAWEYSVL